MVKEKALIETYLLPLSQNHPAALNFADDAALLTPTNGHEIIISKDMLLEGVHFRPTDPPDLIAKKALAVNLSDMAAKAAKIEGVFLGLALPPDRGEGWVKAFAVGLEEMIRQYACPLLGGDSTASKSGVTLSLTIIGQVIAGGMVKRSTAKPGDHLFISGTLGEAALGLKLLDNPALAQSWGLSERDTTFLIARYQAPAPRTDLVPFLKDYATAAMDISDGIIPDLEKFCAASACGAALKIPALPLSAPVKNALAKESALHPLILGWGDDYQLLFTIAKGKLKDAKDRIIQEQLDIVEIGEMTNEAGKITPIDEAGTPITLKTIRYEHFD